MREILKEDRVSVMTYVWGKTRKNKNNWLKILRKKNCSEKHSVIMKRVKCFEQYSERGNTGKYRRSFVEILLLHSVTDNKPIGNEPVLQLESNIYIYIYIYIYN